MEIIDTKLQDKQYIIDYAYELGGKDFVLTLRAENGLFTLNRKSLVIGGNGYYDFGLCQLNKKYHRKFIESNEFHDYKKQLNYCYGVWKDAIKKGRLKTTFYGYNKRGKYIYDFNYIYNE